jgi:hypothetical protein
MRPLTIVRRHGMLLESARGPIPNLAELVDSGDVVRLRLINGKITLVHRQLWPTLVRLADRFGCEQLAAVTEEHTASGAHRKVETAFPDWVPADVMAEAARLSEQDALGLLPSCLRNTAPS